MTYYSNSAIAELYNRKTCETTGLNALLASKDKLFFNHNGIVLSGQSQINLTTQSEQKLLDLIHSLEVNLVAFGLGYLGNITADARILDAGCGAGGGSVLLHQRFGCSIEAITLSHEQARFAHQALDFYGYADRVTIEVGDMLQLERPSGYFDAIWACESTEHVSDLDVMFSRFRKMLKPHSRVVIIAWCATTGLEGQCLKNQVDAHYRTTIHTVDAYHSHAKDNGFVLSEEIDLTEMTAEYWKIRSRSSHCTGSESFMTPGFVNRNITYQLFVLTTL